MASRLLPVAIAGTLISCPRPALQALSWTGTAPAADASLIVDGGDLDIERTFTAAIPAGSGRDPAGTLPGPSADGDVLFQATTPEGDISLHWEEDFAVGAAIWLKVRGVDEVEYRENFAVVGGTDPTARTVNQWRVGDEVYIRAWYRPSTGSAGIRLAVNGVYLPDYTTTTTGGSLATPTAVTLTTSVADSSKPETFTSHLKGDAATAVLPEVIVIGDSTLAPFAAGSSVTYFGIYPMTSVCHDLYTSAERWTRAGVGMLAVPGDTTAGQQTKWSANAWRSNESLKAVIVQVGVNDVNSAPAATVAGWLQTLIDQIHTDRPDVKVLVAKLVPFGNSATPAQLAWLLEFNDDIAGTGPNPITNVDARITSAYTTLDNGSGGYKPQYDYDGEHENNDGRTVIAGAYRTALQSLGVLP